MSNLVVSTMEPSDWPAVAKIFADGIATGDATFETVPPTWEDWDREHLIECRLIARLDEQVVGWAALSGVSDRCVYGGVAEVSVYVADGATGKGVGSQLMRTLIESSERHGVWTLQAGIFPENAPSLALHTNHGFRHVGVRERLGTTGGRWRDVVLLERRSTVVGVD